MHVHAAVAVIAEDDTDAIKDRIFDVWCVAEHIHNTRERLQLFIEEVIEYE